LHVSNRSHPICFVYIDDIVRAFLEIADRQIHAAEAAHLRVEPTYTMTLGELHDVIVSFRDSRTTLKIPDLANPLIKYLYATYISFVDVHDLASPVQVRTDQRGWLFELVKSPHAGQIFVSSTRPGVTRGNHYHDTKVEKFCVIQGEGVVRLRSVLGQEVVEYQVSERAIQVLDIPPGYTHSIENTGVADMLTLFWANEIFDQERPDTHPEQVLQYSATSPISKA
jgi:UDP-2-acetamido-2,6-beta-L-arabino-hexul-4-ose reductase